MKPTKGYYSLIQFCPDLSRAESANVGVLLFCPEVQFIKAMTSTSNDRIRRFFRERAFDLERINATKRSIEERVQMRQSDFKSLDDLESFIATRANEILITPPRPLKVSDPEAELRQLFDELVGGRRRKDIAPEAVVQRLDEVFHRPEFKDRIEFSKRIRLPVMEREIVVPFAFRNGKLNLVRPKTLSPIVTHAENVALQLVGEGKLIEKHQVDTQEAKLIVVYSFRGAVQDSQLPSRIASLFNDFDIKAVPETGIDEFAAEVAKQAHT